MSCDIGEVAERLENELCSNPSIASQLILQPFFRFSYDTAHSPALLLLHLRHSPFSNLSVASPTSQLILQPFFRFSYVTGSSLTSPGEPHMRISSVFAWAAPPKDYNYESRLLLMKYGCYFLW